MVQPKETLVPRLDQEAPAGGLHGSGRGYMKVSGAAGMVHTPARATGGKVHAEHASACTRVGLSVNRREACMDRARDVWREA